MGSTDFAPGENVTRRGNIMIFRFINSKVDAYLKLGENDGLYIILNGAMKQINLS